MNDRAETDRAERIKLSRRGLLTATASSAAMQLAVVSLSAREALADPPTVDMAKARDVVEVQMTVNNRPAHLLLDPRTTLLDAARENLGLTGAKKGCDHGQCGACTMIVGGERVLSCLTLAVAVQAPVTTIEGLAQADGSLHPMQQAFIDQDAFQCGYCTPGQILSAVACVQEGHANKDSDIREYMSGNLCRCAAYPHIVAAIKQAKPLLKGT